MNGIDFRLAKKVENSISLLKRAEKLALALNPEGYWVAFSGGKDSQVLLDLVKKAGVKYRAVYNVTTNDPPMNVYFIRENYPEVEFLLPKQSFFKMIESKGLPTMQRRYCCERLKEVTGAGYLVLTGVRAEESKKRAAYDEITVRSRRKEHVERKEGYTLEGIMQAEHKCIKGKDKVMLYPILEWSTEEIWRYIELRKLPVNPLYEMVGRVGCMFCPFSTGHAMDKYEKIYPKFKELLLKSLQKYIDKAEGTAYFATAEEYYRWWKTKRSLKQYMKDRE